MSLSVVRSADPAAFAARVEPFLGAHEAEHNLILGVLAGVLRSLPGGPPGGPAPLPYLATVEEGGAVRAVAVRTPPHRLLLSRAGPAAEGVVDLLAESLMGVSPDLPGVVGPAPVAAAFVRCWEARGGHPGRQESAMRIFRLDAVTPARGAPGGLRPATEADADLVAEWVVAFRRDTGDLSPGSPGEREDARRIATGSIRAGGLHLWELPPPGGPVSMANATGPTPNGIRINLVYTPPGHRGRGYASAAVGALSQAMLDAGRRFCFLYTDLANPTTNRIYPRLGYRPVADADAYDFPAP